MTYFQILRNWFKIRAINTNCYFNGFPDIDPQIEVKLTYIPILYKIKNDKVISSWFLPNLQ